MIEQFKYIQNVGRFAQVTGNADTMLKELSLVYSENGRGKTTLCAILRSLSSGDGAPILERRRLSATSPSKVVVGIAGGEFVFDGRSWNSAGPPVFVFDEHFVDVNVHSGLSIEAGHRQNLHGLVIGEDGVQYQRRVEELGDAVAELQKAVREAQAAIAQETLGGFSVDEFCALPPVEDIDEKIEGLRRSVSVLSDARKVRAAPKFEALALPLLEVDELRRLLQLTLPEIEDTAVEAVEAHFTSLGDGAETWVAEGNEYLGGREECPFCGQELSRSTLIAHYRAYFAEAYRAHNSSISDAIRRLDQEFGGDALARAQRFLQRAKERHEFWQIYIDIPDFQIETDAIASAWTDARDGLLGALEKKSSKPLEAIELTSEAEAALTRYETIAAKIRNLGNNLLEVNDLVETAKEKAEHGSLPTAESELNRLESTARRHEEATAALCKTYLDAKAMKASAEAEKEEAREALRAHREKVFATYQSSINTFLVKFNAHFRIERLAPSDARGVPSSSYEFIVNKNSIGTGRPGDPEPSFATALSAGDRSTLALAFFFATLQERETLDDAIIVIDDPASSLDDGRAFATVQEIRALIGQAAQVVVLAHARPVLCQLWERADKQSTATIEINNDDGVADASTLVGWDAEAASVTEYDRLHATVLEYADSSSGNGQSVAVALRPVLECFLRVAFVESFPPGRSLGDFLMIAKQARQAGSPILDDKDVAELDNLREYANQFHHNTNRNWQESLSNVNETQLRGYSQRVIGFTRIARSAPTTN